MVGTQAGCLGSGHLRGDLDRILDAGGMKAVFILASGLFACQVLGATLILAGYHIARVVFG